MGTLLTKLTKITGSKASILTSTTNGQKTLKIQSKSGTDLELIAGPEGSDALGKLGLTPSKVAVPYLPGDNDPSVAPGGSYGLSLSHALSLSDAKSAAIAANKIKSAISTTQTAYRSLYWDDAKAALVNGSSSSGTVSAYQSAQAARYQDALSRISSITASFSTTTDTSTGLF
jgi:hypothetical protein